MFKTNRAHSRNIEQGSIMARKGTFYEKKAKIKFYIIFAKGSSVQYRSRICPD